MRSIAIQIEEILARDPVLVTEPSEVPGTYESLTNEWLTNVICGNHPATKVVSFEVGTPDNGTSNRRRLYLTYNDAGRTGEPLPQSLFCKAATSVETRTTLAMCGGSRNEAYFYNQARPQLAMRASEAVFAGFDPDTYAYFVMMHELGEQTRFPYESYDVSRAEAESMVDTLATLHSTFYDRPELGGPALALPFWYDMWPNGFTYFEDSCDVAFGESEHIMSPRLFKRRAEIWPKTMASAELHRSLPATLLHGDTHLRNWFVDADGQLGLFDWQGCNVGHWSRDFIYAFTTSLSIENRRTWLKELLELYLDKMAERGVARVSQDDAIKSCRQQLMTALAYWTMCLRPAEGAPDMQPESATWTFLERFFAAIDDLDALDAFADL